MTAVTAASRATRLLAPLAAGLVVLVLFGDETARAIPGVQDVNVVNTPAVTVANTPSIMVTNVPDVTVANAVRLAERTLVGIDAANNLVRIDPESRVVVDGSSTAIVVNQFFNGDVGPVDVSAFKQIRIMVQSVISTSCAFTPVVPWGGGVFDKTRLSGPVTLTPGGHSTATYDVPGPTLQIESNCAGHVMVFGRTN